jgi:hypothetical protein
VLVENQAGSVTSAGTIAAGYDGVSLNHGGQVTNSVGGTITGEHIGVYTGYGLGSVANSGLITARTGDAVSLYTGGSLSNSAAGRIIGGYSGVYAGGKRVLHPECRDYQRSEFRGVSDRHRAM